MRFCFWFLLQRCFLFATYGLHSLEKTAEELERARSELVALREEKEELEERLGEAQEAAAATERYEELDQNVERESQGDRDWKVEEPALKVSGLEAGAIVEETEF